VASLVAVSVGLAVLTWGGAEASATGLASRPARAAASSFSGEASILFGPPPPGLLHEGPLEYRETGGGVQHSPHIYAIFWGKNWTIAPGTEAKAMLLKLFEGLSNSAYEGILTQYFDSTGRVGKTVGLTTYTDTSVTAPTSVTEATAKAEVTSAIETNKWTAEKNNQFMVLPAPGSTYGEPERKFCGYHGQIGTGAIFGLVPYQGDKPFSENSCSSGDLEKSAIHITSRTASHEFTEMVTDPEPMTWNAVGGPEIADLCEEEKDVELPSGAWAANIWDDTANAVNRCSHSDLEPPHVYGVNSPVSEVTKTGATLKGTVNPESLETTYFFEYGLTTSYGTKTATVSAGSTNKNQAVSAALSGLTGSTTYNSRIVVTNSTGTVYSRDRQFKTS
jgi:hypothetical protein